MVRGALKRSSSSSSLDVDARTSAESVDERVVEYGRGWEVTAVRRERDDDPESCGKSGPLGEQANLGTLFRMADTKEERC